MASTVGRIALGIALLIPLACGSSDAEAPAEPRQPSAIASYQTWIESWRDEATDWSTAWLAATKKLDTQIGPDGLKLADARDFARGLSPKAAELDKALVRVGEPESGAAPVEYVTATRTAASLLGSHASALQTCTTTCTAEFESVQRVGLSLEDLVLQTSGQATATSDVTRTVPLVNGILTEEDVPGATPLGDGADLLDYLCTPTYEKDDAIASLPEPQAEERGAFATAERVPTFHDLRQLTSRTEAWRWFQTLKVRAAGCGLGQHRGVRDAGGTWTYGVGPTLSVPTFQWTASYASKSGTLTGRVMAALVDDTVVLVMVRSVGKPPDEALARSLLSKEIRKLGVDPIDG